MSIVDELAGHPVATCFDDPRGRLVALEFGDLPFVPQRAFVVVGPEGPVTRGGHLAGCQQLVVLVTGSAEVRLSSPHAGDRRTTMDLPGQRLLVDADEHVSYDLLEPRTTLLVMADTAYVPRDGRA